MTSRASATQNPPVNRTRDDARSKPGLRALLGPPRWLRKGFGDDEEANPWRRHVASWFASLVIHALGMILVGLLGVSLGMGDGPGGGGTDSRYLAGTRDEPDWGALSPVQELASAGNDAKSDKALQPAPEVGEAGGVTAPEPMLDTIGLSNVKIGEGQAAVESAGPIGSVAGGGALTGEIGGSVSTMLARENSLLRPIGSGIAEGPGGAGGLGRGGWGGRDSDLRKKLAFSRGGTQESEDAVERGLKWLAAHQHEDGGWRFNHEFDGCQGLCRNPGSHPSTTGSTALALLPFFGAGETHIKGNYMQTVRNGLYYLTSRIQMTDKGADLQEGSIYSHGLASILLCEAYAMTNDDSLKEPAQQALNYIVYWQDKTGGGWRYSAGQPGDTTVTGWQLMALKSGQMAYLRVPESSFKLAAKFLDSTGSEGGSQYTYQPSGGPRASTTAVGLLSRMYLGWPRDHVGLSKGVRKLSIMGPSRHDMYYNYYATQVLHHFGGTPWREWNKLMREYLIDQQARTGHENGSWFFPEMHTAESGGRLYNTTMSIMILEVYYRHMPLYRETAIDAE